VRAAARELAQMTDARRIEFRQDISFCFPEKRIFQ
jgi:hypothetical protein